MRDSGVGYLGEIPAEWGISRLKFLLRRKLQYGVNESGIEFQEDLPRYVRITDIDDDGQLKETGKQSLPADIAQPYLLIDGDVLLARSGSVGKSYFYSESKNGAAAFAGYLIRAQTNPEVLVSRYFYYCTLHAGFENWIQSVSTQTTIQNVGADKYAQYEVPVPPLPEQGRIAEWLDERCADIDSAVEVARASIDEYEAYKKSVISHAVTRGLDPDAPLKDTGIRWIGAIPEHWETVPIKAVTKRRSGHTPDRKIPEYWDGDIVWVSLADSPYLRKHRYISESKNHITSAGIEHSSAEILPSGCVLLSRDATVGLCAITKKELAVSQHFMAYECGPAIYNEYLLDVFYAMNDELIGMSMGSTIPTIGLPLIRKLVTPLPPLPEQRRIASYLDARTAAIDAVVAQKRAIVEDLLAYKKSLIYEAVTGKREV